MYKVLQLAYGSIQPKWRMANKKNLRMHTFLPSAWIFLRSTYGVQYMMCSIDNFHLVYNYSGL